MHTTFARQATHSFNLKVVLYQYRPKVIALISLPLYGLDIGHTQITNIFSSTINGVADLLALSNLC